MGLKDYANQSQVLTIELQKDHKGFELLSQLLLQHTGIYLPANDKNRSLLANRIYRVMQSYGVTTYAEYLKHLKSQHFNPQLIAELTSAMTTNTTEFFRESEHFDIFSKLLLKGHQVKPGSELRVWCAAASTGQEPYSIAMTLRENLFQGGQGLVRFLATDLDHQVLEKSSMGIYTEQELSKVPPVLRQKYFQPLPKTGFHKQYVASKELKSMITFAPFNLVSFPYGLEHRFDYIFCRNVLIYFDRPMAIKVVDILASHLKVGGHLFVGHSETGVVTNPSLAKAGPATYRRER